MMSFNASMLREKFVIADLDASDDDAEMIVTSNRLEIPLVDASGTLVQTIIVRAKFMHHTLRMGAFVIREFDARGPFHNRKESIDFDAAWESVLSAYDKKHETDSWVSLFSKGDCIYASKKLHPFLDVIEQCDVQNPDDYDFSVAMAEGVFQKAGKNIKIDYAGTLGMVATLKGGVGRCGLICRSPNDTTTFNFMVDGQNLDEKPFTPSKCLNTSADFLETVQLAFTIGFIEAKMDKALVKPTDPEGKKLLEAKKRNGILNGSIKTLEKEYSVRYRPEKPDFNLIMRQSQSRGKSVLS